MSISNNQLKSIVERIQRLNEDEAAIKDDKKEVFAEAKANGYNPKIIRALIKYLNEDATSRDEFDAEFDLYLRALNGSDETGMNRATQAQAHEANASNVGGA